MPQASVLTMLNDRTAVRLLTLTVNELTRHETVQALLLAIVGSHINKDGRRMLVTSAVISLHGTGKAYLVMRTAPTDT